ncbi:uncharacterized protein LOC120167254 [Hibiscus syriacus]|uniref:uncharacterized protein LOC120167254 n=1 Tax=Hibiscus syriacus TaxID=106335 RepID=UPI0019210E71|nr:uncharacterized protein LOC120167254 [Hibiscus syriacus]
MLFSWEFNMWDDFIRTLNEAAQGSKEVDVTRWVGEPSGVYTPSSFCSASVLVEDECDNFWSLVWANLTPPKVELLVWRAVLQRLPVRVELEKRGCLNSESCACMLCLKESESVNHLFCRCEVVWRAWSRWCAIWNLHLVCPGDVRSFISSWVGAPISKSSKPVWKLALFEFFGSIWLLRNEIIFNRSNWSEEKLFDSVVSRIGCWCKWKWPEEIVSFSDFCSNPSAMISVRR